VSDSGRRWRYTGEDDGIRPGIAKAVRREMGFESAFAEVVRRHVNLVYSAALRQVRLPQLAEEVAQSVFTDLARNAQRLAPDTILTAWFYQVTRRTAIDVVRHESRRQLREQIANRNECYECHPPKIGRTSNRCWMRRWKRSMGPTEPRCCCG